jgi:PAS domain S-box-containing protein
MNQTTEFPPEALVAGQELGYESQANGHSRRRNQNQNRGRLGWRGACLMLALLGTLTVSAPAAEVPLKVRIGVESNAPPLSFVNAQGQPDGFTAALLREVGRAGGIEFEVVPDYWRFLTQAFQAGRLNALANVTITEGRRATMDFSISHAYIHGIAYTRPGDPPIRHTSQFAGRKMAALAGTIAYDDALEHGAWGATVIIYHSSRKMLEAVVNGQCDFALVTRSLKTEQPDELGLSSEFVDDIIHPFSIAVHQGDARTLARINEGLAIVRANGPFDRLYAQWIGPIEPHPIRLNDLRPYKLPIVLTLLLAAAFFWWQRHVNRRLARQAAALRASEQDLAITMQSIGDAVIATDAAGRITRMNGAAERLTGWVLADARGRPLPEVFHIINAQTRAPATNPVQLVLERGEIVGLANHTALLSRDGREYQISDSAAPIREAAGQIVGVVLVFSDVTEDYRVQQALVATTALLERTGELANVGGWELDVRTMKLSWSAETCRIHEVVPPFAPTLDLALNFYAPEARPVIQAAVQAAIEHGTPFDQELALITAKGRPIWVRAQCSPVMTDGKATRLLGAFHDVTERKVAEDQLALQEARFRAVFDHAPVGISLTTPSGVIMVNAEHARITGVPIAESDVPGAFARASHPEDYARQMVAAQKFQRNEVGHYTVEKRYLHPDGRVQWTELTSRFFTDPGARERMIVTILTDLTERKAAEEMLQRSEAQLRRAEQVAGIGNWELDFATQKMTASANARQLYGLGVGPFDLADIQAQTLPGQRARLDAALRALIETGQPYDVEFQIRRANDGRICDIRSMAEYDQANGKLFGVIQDMTAFMQAAAELRESQEAFQGYFQMGSIGMCVTSPEKGWVEVNDCLCRMLGYTKTELGGLTWAELTHPDDLASDLVFFEQLLAGKRERYELDKRFIRKDGSVIDVTLNVACQRNADGTVNRILASLLDITERKRAEAVIHAALEEKTALLGEKEALLGEVHHRVKNNLQVVTSLLRLEAGRSAQADTKGVLNDMQGRIRSMALLHEVLYRAGTFAAVDLGAYVRELAIQSFRVQAVSPGAVRLHLELAAVTVSMDQAMPCGLLVNELVSNCLKHGFPDGRAGEVRVELQPEAGGAQWRLRVSDTGIGLPADFAARRGQSLGLQLASGLAQQINGELAIGPGPAAVFTVIFTPKVAK